MMLELLNELGLMILVNVGDFFCFNLFEASSLDVPISDVFRIGEPNREVLVFQELAVHSDYFNIVKLRNVICHLRALLLTVLLLIALN